MIEITDQRIKEMKHLMETYGIEMSITEFINDVLKDEYKREL